MKVSLPVAALLGRAACSPIKCNEDCPESSTVDFDPINARVVTSELPTYPGGYQPLPYGPPRSLSTSSGSSEMTVTISLSTAPGMPSSSQAGAITASGSTKPSGTAPVSSASNTATIESSKVSARISSLITTAGSSSGTAVPTGTSPTTTIETITVPVHSSTPPYTGGPYSSLWPVNTSSSAIAIGTGTGLLRRPPSGSWSTGMGASTSTTHVTSIVTLSLTKTVETTIYPSGSSGGPVNSSNSTLSSPVTESGGLTSASASDTAQSTITSTSLEIVSVIITLSTISSTPSGTAPLSLSTVSVSVSASFGCSAVNGTPLPCVPPFPTGPAPYNYSSLLPTSRGRLFSFSTGKGGWPSYPTVPAPNPYSYTWPTGTGGRAASSALMTYTTGLTTGPSTGSSSYSGSTTTLTETLTLTIPSGGPSSPPLHTSPSTTRSEVSTSGTTSEATSTSTLNETISVTVIPFSSSSSAITPSTVSSEGSPVNTSNSTVSGSGSTTATSSAYLAPYGYTPLPERSITATPSPIGSEGIPMAASESPTAIPTNTPFPLPSSSQRMGSGISYMPPNDEMPQVGGWWAAFVDWWQGNGRKH